MESIEKGLLREIEKSFILQQIDYSWMEHLQKITFLRESIRWRAYGQKDPLTEYKKESFNYFLIMFSSHTSSCCLFCFTLKSNSSLVIKKPLHKFLVFLEIHEEVLKCKFY